MASPRKKIDLGRTQTLANIFRGPRRERPLLVGAPKVTPIPIHRITPIQYPYSAKTQKHMPNPGKQVQKFAPTV